MPFVQVHLARAIADDARDRLGLALARAYGEHMQTSSRIVNVGFPAYPEGGLARYDANGAGEAHEMAIVTCDIREGRTPEVLEAFGRAITELCARELELPELRVAVYLTEHAAHEIYRDGGRAPGWTPLEAAT